MDVSLSPRSRTVVLWVGAIAAGFILLEAAHALRPFAWAIITAFILHPLVAAIHRKTHLPKGLITTWLYLMIGLLVTILIINFAPTVVEQFDGFRGEVPNASTSITDWLEKNQKDELDQLGIDPADLRQRIDDATKQASDAISKAAVPVLLGTVSIAIELIIYLVASFYFIVHGDRFVHALRSLLHQRYHGEFDRLIAEINSTLSAYIRGQALLVAIMSVCAFAILTGLQVQYAILLAIATGFLELIPLVGPWAAGAIAVSVGLFQDTTPFGWSHLTLAFAIGIAYFALRQLEDAFVIPNVIGRIVHLHPLLVIFVIVVGTTLGGVLGLIVAVPIAAVIKIFASYLYGKLMTRSARHIVAIDDRAQLAGLTDSMADRVNWTVVLMIEPGILAWDDLPAVQRLADAAAEHSVALSAVTPDSIAGTLFTAVGLETASIPPSIPAPTPFGTLVS